MKRKTLGYIITGVCVLALLIGLYLAEGIQGLSVILIIITFGSVLIFGVFLIFDDTKSKPITANDIIDKSVLKEFSKLNKVLNDTRKLQEELYRKESLQLNHTDCETCGNNPKTNRLCKMCPAYIEVPGPEYKELATGVFYNKDENKIIVVDDCNKRHEINTLKTFKFE